MAEIKHKGARIAGVIVTLITLTAWLPALQNGFVNWDDNTYVYENPHIKSLDFKFLKWAFSSFYFNNYHPITMLSYALDHSIWGLNPFGYHVTNVIFHAANTFLVFVLAVRLMECGMREKTEDKKNLSITQPLKLSTSQPLDQKTPNFHLIAAAVTALLFGLHPIHVESVAWVSERKDVLCAFFFLLSLLAYVRYVSSEGFKKVRSYAVCLFFFTLALMSKPMAVTLPLVLLILDYCPFNRLTLKGILEKIPFFLLSFVFSLLTIWAQQSDGALKTMETFPLINRILIAIHGYLFYLLKRLFSHFLQ